MVLIEGRPLKRERLPGLAACVIAAGACARVLFEILRIWPEVEGHEPELIARALVAGHGYSFPGDQRWLFPDTDPGLFFPTAWQDPVFTYILAGCFWLFGESGRLAVLLFNLLCLVVSFALAYRVGKSLAGPWVAVLVVGLLAFHPLFPRHAIQINNVLLAAVVVLVTNLAALRYLEVPSWRRLLILALCLGITVLACPAARLLLPGATLVVLWAQRRVPRLALMHAGTMVLVAALVIAPWTIRNYLTFGEFVLVRNGGGQMAYVSSVAAAETFMPGVAGSTLPAPWRSNSPREAVQRTTVREYRRPLNTYMVQALVVSPPPGYNAMNEAQRDKMYMARATEFLKRHPAIAAEMAMKKLEIYARICGRYGVALLALAAVGAATLVRRERSWLALLSVGGYSAIFALIVAYYPRYRLPIEPLLAVLAGAGIAACAFAGRALLRKAK